MSSSSRAANQELSECGTEARQLEEAQRQLAALDQRLAMTLTEDPLRPSLELSEMARGVKQELEKERKAREASRPEPGATRLSSELGTTAGSLPSSRGSRSNPRRPRDGGARHAGAAADAPWQGQRTLGTRSRHAGDLLTRRPQHGRAAQPLHSSG